MKFNKKTILIFLSLFLIPTLGLGSNFKADKDVTIGSKLIGDTYIASEKIIIDNEIEGDLNCAGASILINKTIGEDLNAAGQEIIIRGEIKDDAKIIGDEIQITNNIDGSLIIFGSKVSIAKTVNIQDDVIIFANSVEFEGNSNGKVSIWASNVNFNGQVLLDANIHASNLNIGENSLFLSNLEYSNLDGPINIKKEAVLGKTTFNEKSKNIQKENTFNQFFSLSLIRSILSAGLVILLIIISKTIFFEDAVTILSTEKSQSFLIGALYFISTPIVAIVLMITIIGLPLGLLTVFAYGFSLYFAGTISALIVAKHISVIYKIKTEDFKLLLLSLAVFICFQLIYLIPFIGSLTMIVIVCTSIGSLIRSKIKA